MTTGLPRRSIDGLIAELLALGKISEAEPPVVTRVVFSEADLRARAFVKGLCVKAGLAVSEDAVGNTFARWGARSPGSRRSGRDPILTQFPMQACTTDVWACLARWKPSAP